MDPRLQVLNSHFVGVWAGTNVAYNSPTVTVPVRIVVTNDSKKGRLRLEYIYGTKGQKSYDHAVRFMVIDPASSRVTLNWRHNSDEVYKAVGLEEVLNAGYGSFGFFGAVQVNGLKVLYRQMLELTADSFYYCWEKTSDGVDYSKTGEWTLTRESGANTSAGTKPGP